MSRTPFGGRHELGQNFLHHRPTVDRLVALVMSRPGPVLEIGAGDGAITRPLVAAGRDVTAIDLDERRTRRLQRSLPRARIEHADALRYPLTFPVVVGNIPFHLTTPLLRRLLRDGTWERAVLVTQWEVARKRAGVGGSTMMTAQAAPWFEFRLEGRVPRHHFKPSPSVDGGILTVSRRPEPLVPPADRARYERFVAGVFTGRGGSLAQVVGRAAGIPAADAGRLLRKVDVAAGGLPRDLTPRQWVRLAQGMRR